MASVVVWLDEVPFSLAEPGGAISPGQNSDESNNFTIDLGGGAIHRISFTAGWNGWAVPEVQAGEVAFLDLRAGGGLRRHVC